MNRQGYSTGHSGEVWFDLYEDWGLIEASFATQYGIRLREETEMSWGEFTTLLAGIMPKTPLGQVISIRSENDKDMLKHFTKEQHKVRNKWRNRNLNKLVKMDKREAKRQIQMFQNMCKNVFGNN